MPVFASKTVLTTQGAPTGGLPYDGTSVFSEDELVEAPEDLKELTFNFTVAEDAE